MVIILMGVSGCGKSTLGKLLSKDLNLPFYDADDFHPDVNVDKMIRGESLTDDDRAPWLHRLSVKIDEWNQGKGAILACSALKEKYRNQLRGNTETESHRYLSERNSSILFIYLKGSKELIESRLRNREGHYMPPELLDSQFADLEEPTDALIVNIDQKPKAILYKIKLHLHEHFNISADS